MTGAQRGDFGRSPGAAGTGHDRYLGEDDPPSSTDLMANLQRSLGLPPRPAPVPHAEAGDELREALERTLEGHIARFHESTEEGQARARQAADALLAGPLAPLLAKLRAVEALADEWDAEHADWCCQGGCPAFDSMHPGPVIEWMPTVDASYQVPVTGPSFPCPGTCSCEVGRYRDGIRAALAAPQTGQPTTDEETDRER